MGLVGFGWCGGVICAGGGKAAGGEIGSKCRGCGRQGYRVTGGDGPNHSRWERGGRGMFCQVQRTLHNLHCDQARAVPCPASTTTGHVKVLGHPGDAPCGRADARRPLLPALGLLRGEHLLLGARNGHVWGLANGGDGGGGSGSDRGLSELPPAGTASLLPLSRGTGWQKQGGGGRYCRGAPRGGGARCLLSPLDWVGAACGLAGAKVAYAAHRWRQSLSPILSLRVAWVGDGLHVRYQSQPRPPPSPNPQSTSPRASSA